VKKTSLSLLVFGATGPTGRRLVEQALAGGHRVTACVRDPGKLELEHASLQVQQGDILDANSLARSFDTAIDSVACTVGMFHKQPETWLSDGTRNIVAQMKEHGIGRIVAVSSLGAGDSRGQGNLLAKAIQRFILREVLNDKTRQEQVLSGSDLDWTVFRPPQLTDDPAVREDIVLWTGKPPRQRMTWKVSRATVARYVLEALQTGAHSRSAVNMSEPA
jgi:uncharacterized protein YbjT (DUF2867 family)